MQSSESGAWLTANPRINSNQLSNTEFSESLRIRLGIPLFAFPFQCVCGENCDEMGFHAYTCCKSKCERNERHQHIKVAVWDMLQHFLPNVLKHNEPYMIPTFTKINPPDIDPECLHIPQRADLAVKDLNDHVFNYYVDYTITHPGSTALRSKYNKVGYAAEQVAQHKWKKYASYYDLQSTPDLPKMVMFGIESFGTFAKEGKDFVKACARLTVFNNNNNNYYSVVLHHMIQRVSIALQITNLKQLLNLSMLILQLFRICN